MVFVFLEDTKFPHHQHRSVLNYISAKPFRVTEIVSAVNQKPRQIVLHSSNYIIIETLLHHCCCFESSIYTKKNVKRNFCRTLYTPILFN